MLAVAQLDWRRRWGNDPLLRALVISVTFHLLMFSFVEVGNRLDLWRFSPLAVLARALGLQPAYRPPPRVVAAKATPKPAPEPMLLQFVDVDPSQAAAQAPPKTQFYSAFNSVASNRRAGDADRPKLEGNQQKVLKTMDTARAKPAAQPLRPTPPPEPAPKPEPAAPKVAAQPLTPTPAPPVRPVSPPKPAPAPVPKAAMPPGDLAMATPAPTPPAEATTPAPGETEAAVRPVPVHVRPRTLQEAGALLNGGSALQGETYKQEGGVRHISLSPSMDVQGTEIGSYDARFIAAVQKRWFDLLSQLHFSLDCAGKVVVEFRLTYDGRIQNINTVDSDVGDFYTQVCRSAITDPAPYEKWSDNMRRLVGTNYREVRFTFYY